MENEKKFYLTFDGAPNPPMTDRILETLEKHSVTATFFMEGRRVDNEPDCARRVLQAGHAVGNHSYTHPDFSALSLAECDEEIRRTQDALLRHLGVEARLLRPPFGKIEEAALRHFEEMGFTVALWDYSVRDWEGPDAEAVAARVLGGLSADEATIVLHDHVEWNPDVIERIVPEIRRRGYRFCPKVSAGEV